MYYGCIMDSYEPTDILVNFFQHSNARFLLYSAKHPKWSFDFRPSCKLQYRKKTSRNTSRHPVSSIPSTKLDKVMYLTHNLHSYSPPNSTKWCILLIISIATFSSHFTIDFKYIGRLKNEIKRRSRREVSRLTQVFHDIFQNFRFYVPAFYNKNVDNDINTLRN